MVGGFIQLEIFYALHFQVTVEPHFLRMSYLSKNNFEKNAIEILDCILSAETRELQFIFFIVN